MEAIKTEKLVKKYKDKTAVKGLELTVYQGELYGLLGVNGAGQIHYNQNVVLPDTAYFGRSMGDGAQHKE